jgi:muramoyltetrapeptide carboxypeptidase LdcA involved in peptidoglycan recycling
MGAQGIWDKAKGIIFARPGGQRTKQEFCEYEKTLTQVVGEEYGKPDLPILANMDFGHTDPIFTIPYGVQAEIDCSNKKFSILEPGVV